MIVAEPRTQALNGTTQAGPDLRRAVRVVSITEHADDSPTGKLMEAIIESVDEFYSENLMPMVQSRQNPRLALPA